MSNVSKVYFANGIRYPVFCEASAEFSGPGCIGVLATSGSGKSCLLRLLSGMEPPDAGVIERDVQVSWPLGFQGVIDGALSGRQNAAFVARLRGLGVAAFCRKVADLSELAERFDLPVSTYPKALRQQLVCVLGLAVDFDCYLVDEKIALPGQEANRRVWERLRELKRSKTIIISSSNVRMIRRECDRIAVIQERGITFFEDPAAGLERYAQLCGVGGKDRKRPRGRRGRDSPFTRENEIVE